MGLRYCRKWSRPSLRDEGLRLEFDGGRWERRIGRGNRGVCFGMLPFSGLQQECVRWYGRRDGGPPRPRKAT